MSPRETSKATNTQQLQALALDSERPAWFYIPALSLGPLNTFVFALLPYVQSGETFRSYFVGFSRGLSRRVHDGGVGPTVRGL